MLELKAVGDKQKLSDQDLSTSEGESLEPFFSTSMIRLGTLGRLLISDGICSASIGWKATAGRLTSSLISLIV